MKTQKFLIALLGISFLFQISCIRKKEKSPNNSNPQHTSSQHQQVKPTPKDSSDQQEPEDDFWTQKEGYRWAKLEVPSVGQAGFTLLAPEVTGIHFKNELSDEGSIRNQILNSGSGVAAGDFDNDGLCDIYLCNLEGKNILYKNMGKWTFQDVTAESSLENTDLSCEGRVSVGCSFADIDGDRDLDLIVTSIGQTNRCFLNDGHGKFSDVSEKAGFNTNLGSTSVALSDIDGDGDLDLYISNYRKETLKDFGGELPLKMDKDGFLVIPKEMENRLYIEGKIRLEKIDGKFILPEKVKQKLTAGGSAIREFGEVDLLYLNDGSGKFSPVPFLGGAFLDENGKPLEEEPKDWGLAVIFRDFDQDGDPDIYVCNDFWSPDRIWVNQGNGTFQAMPSLAVRNTSATSMGVDFSDIDRDGDYDFFVVDMLSRDHQRRKMQMGAMKPTPIEIGMIDNRPQIMRNTLHLNRGDNTYAEIALLAGVQDTEWSWCPVFFDADLDGYEDLFVTNGHARDVQDADTNNRIASLGIQDAQEKRRTMLMYPRLMTKNIMYHNNGHLHFKEVGKDWGVDQKLISHGVGLADFDGDGDMDFIINNLNHPATLYRNNTKAARVSVRLKGKAPNTYGIGAEIRLLGGIVPLQSQEMICGGRYLSGCDTQLTFAAGDVKKGMTLEVLWRNGTRSVIENVKANRLYEIDESSAKPYKKPMVRKMPETFREVPLAFRHQENEFDDFAHQLLLPNRFSQMGPGTVWHDIDGDGDDDLIIGSGKGGKLAVYQNEGNSKFTLLAFDDLPTTTRDQAGLVSYTNSDGSVSILVGLANFEDATNEGSSLVHYQYKEGKLSNVGSLDTISSSTGPVSVADVDGDGDLDVFVGGRTIAKEYPRPATSRLYLNQNGQFVLDEKNAAELKDIGLVSGSVFSDLDGDGDADLVLALEWGPVTILVNHHGEFIRVSKEDSQKQKLESKGLGKYLSWDLSKHLGWWNGVATGDLNGDGRMDIVATNWGLNSKYHYYPGHPLKIYYDDFDGNGVLDIVEAHFDKYRKAIVPERGLSCSSRCMPFIREKLSTYEKYGASNLVDIYGARILSCEQVEANELSSMIFLNNGPGFDSKVLPIEAQFAPGFGVSVADYDGDGKEDIFMTLNFYASQIETPRCDAGLSLWLKGDGKGNFTAVPGHESGVRVYGDSRGASLADFNGDGRIDLVVAQNGSHAKLYQNEHGKPGLRIRVKGPASNPDAVGAQVRVGDAGKLSPAREIQAGSGYWSQDSKVQVLHVPQGASQPVVEVKWPGGKTTTSALPKGAKEVQVEADGTLTVVR